jgi:hypothetical protein
MSQQSSSIELETTWGKFSLRERAQAAQTKLSEVGIAPQNITLETENFSNPVKLEDTEAIANLKSGAIAPSFLMFIIIFTFRTFIKIYILALILVRFALRNFTE